MASWGCQSREEAEGLQNPSLRDRKAGRNERGYMSHVVLRPQSTDKKRLLNTCRLKGPQSREAQDGRG